MGKRKSGTKRKVKMETGKSRLLMITTCKPKKKSKGQKLKKKARSYLNQSNISPITVLNDNSYNEETNSMSDESERCWCYYDDLKIDSSPKPLKHPYTLKAQQMIIEKSVKPIGKSPLLKTFPSINADETKNENLVKSNFNDEPAEETSNKSEYRVNNYYHSSSVRTYSKYDHEMSSENGSTNNDGGPNSYHNSLPLITSSDDDSDTDVALVKRHPNRRLQVEKTSLKPLNESLKSIESTDLCDPVIINGESSISSPNQYQPVVSSNNPTSFGGSLKGCKSSEMWVDVLKNPNHWKTEAFGTMHSYQDSSKNLKASSKSNGFYEDDLIDYEEFIEDFKELKSNNNYTLYERRVQEKLNDPNYRTLLAEYYIPPARMEILQCNITSDMTQQECLTHVCTEMNWTQPTYTLTSRSDGKVHYACNLKSKSFQPKRPGLSESLNKELAAFECLNWLGFEHRRGKNLNWSSMDKAFYDMLLEYARK